MSSSVRKKKNKVYFCVVHCRRSLKLVSTLADQLGRYGTFVVSKRYKWNDELVAFS